MKPRHALVAVALAGCALPSCDEKFDYEFQKANRGGAAGRANTQGGSAEAGAASGDGGTTGLGGANPLGGKSPLGGAAQTSGGRAPSEGGAALGQAGENGAGANGGENGSAGSGGAITQPPLVYTEYAADHPSIRFVGRIDFGNPKSPRFSQGAIHVQARFSGTAVRVRIDDEFRYGAYRDYFDVVLDGVRSKLAPTPGQTVYQVAEGLPDGEHSITLVKRTEAGIGQARFLGFDFAGTILTPPAAPLHKLEFVGDSISCGSGSEAKNGSAQCSEDGWGQPYHSGDLAYGPVLARNLGADYLVTAVSGIGLVRNYSNQYDARTMAQVYDLLFLDSTSSPTWDTTRYVPDAVVVMLGTNDFSPGDNPPENPRASMDKAVYRDAYIAFVDRLLGYYPNAHVFGVSSPMLGDGWPKSTDTFATDLKNVLSDVEAHYASNTDVRFHKFFVKKVAGAGCGTHPDVAQHADMASQLGPFIQSVMGW